MAESLVTNSAVPSEVGRRFRANAAAVTFGSANLVTAAIVAYAVFWALPARYGPVDALALLVVGALAGSGLGLLGRYRWGETVTRIAAALALAAGLLLIGMLALAVSYLYGIYDQVGRGGATILVLAGVLAFPYLVGYPALQLYWLGLRRGSSKVAK